MAAALASRQLVGIGPGVRLASGAGLGAGDALGGDGGLTGHRLGRGAGGGQREADDAEGERGQDGQGA